MVILLGLSLSMDAFSLAIIYGINKLSKRKEILLSTIVGIYHFIMPIIGSKVGNIIFNYLPVDPNIIVSILFIIIGIEMSLSKEDKPKPIDNIFGMLLFGLAVSIDSLVSGIGLKYITNHILLSALFISLTSFILTYIGLTFGKKIGFKLGKISNIVGGIVLVLLGIIYLFK